MGNKVSAVSIKKLWHIDPSMVNDFKATITGSDLYAFIHPTDSTKCEEIKNIHQDTWTLEESESSQDSYRNQLTGSVYRMGVKQMGDITVNFTIGQYDYDLKAKFLGGKVSEGGNGWERPRGIFEVQRGFIALTADDQYCFLPKCNVNAHEANTDGAIGIAIVATAMEPDNELISPEYWFDTSEVVAKG